MTDESQCELDRVFDQIERELPASVARAVRWLRSPTGRWVRLPVGVLFTIGGLLWFLPVLGIEMLPIGLLLIAQDVPAVRRPLARVTRWLEQRWRDSKQWRAASVGV